MRIAINTRFLLSRKMEGFGWYTYEIVKRLVEKHPEHEFILFFDRKFDEKFVFGPNAIPVVLHPQARHPFLFFLWFEISVRRALKKHKADVFFSPDGYLSLGSTAPQIPVIHDINFEHNPQDLPWLMRKYLRYYFPKFARKAKHIITVSNYSANDIHETYSIPREKISAIWNGVSDAFKPVSDEEKSTIREKYSCGKPYFLFVGALHPRKNVKRLILAFEKFRKMNPESDYVLVIVGEELWNNANVEIPMDRNTKDKIFFTGHLPLEDLTKVMAGAAVFTYVPYFEGFGIPLVEAMRCGTPIIAGNRTSLPEVAGDAALYCDPFNVNDIASRMTELTKDNNLRKELSSKGLERSKGFSWDNAAEEVWEVLNSVIH